MSLKTPLNRVRGLGSAREGVTHFWQQRVTAVALVPLSIWFLIVIVSLTQADYETAAQTLKQPIIAIPMLLLLISGFYHMKLGLQVVIEDWIDGDGMKIALLLLNTFFAYAIGLACVFSVLKIAFGS